MFIPATTVSLIFYSTFRYFLIIIIIIIIIKINSINNNTCEEWCNLKSECYWKNMHNAYTVQLYTIILLLSPSRTSVSSLHSFPARNDPHIPILWLNG